MLKQEHQRGLAVGPTAKRALHVCLPGVAATLHVGQGMQLDAEYGHEYV